MPESLALGMALAVLFFWAVGAYNRLVRQRSAALQAFALLEVPLRQHLELLESCLPASLALTGQTQSGELKGELPGETTLSWYGLRDAAGQFAASLAAARAQPLHPGLLAALAAAQGVLAMAWQRLQHERAHDLAGAALPATVQARLAQLGEQTRLAADSFNQAVVGYNGAINQFPAVLLAWLFGFKPAGPL